MTNHNSPQPTEQPEGEIRLDLTHEDLIRVLKGVSLIDLTGCEFENGIDQQLFYVNAISGGRVVDAISWDGNVFRMMNNDESFDLLNPMIEGFKIAYHLKYDAEPLPSQPSVDALGEERIVKIINSVLGLFEPWKKEKKLDPSEIKAIAGAIYAASHPSPSVDALALEKYSSPHGKPNPQTYAFIDGYKTALASHPSPSVDAEPSPQEAVENVGPFLIWLLNQRYDLIVDTDIWERPGGFQNTTAELYRLFKSNK